MSIRKRKNYFHGEYRTKKKNRLNILNKMQETEAFCQSIGLEFENIVCKEIKEENPKKLTENDIIIIKETQKKKISSYNEKTFKAMKAKDITNQSNEKYNVQRNLMDYCEFPSLKRIKRMQKKINQLFEIKQNFYGVYCNPKKKIDFVCQKYLNEHKFVQNDQFIIKLSGKYLNFLVKWFQLKRLS